LRARLQFLAYPEDRVPEALLRSLSAPRPAPTADEPVPPISRPASRRPRNDVLSFRRVDTARVERWRAYGERTLPTTIGCTHPGEIASWAEAPLAVGLSLVFLPPAGVALLWASPRFSGRAKAAVTLFTALQTMLLAAVLLLRA
jgi:hypothetical protein